MTDRSTRDVVARYWPLMAGNDFHAVGAVLADGFTFDMPQSGERIRGRDAYAAMNTAYPAAGPWRFEVRRLLVDGGSAVTEVDVSDGRVRGRAVTWFEVRAGRIASIVEYWPEPFPPRPERSQWVEPGPSMADASA